ncbi:DUF3606 domain-containing protein [Sinorhizobium americanum]|uniref:Uncharacterized protein n=1 Tax=Sinorhizobium americanum TaxID=194963 RepID=A0A1L3LTA6_9HYPH|nr:DUF3606 domain-containing protein [Sinorhizobium americanum]APG93315.1 hypothetical protein SAMCFNEI73_pB0115 [Sinorhizobium americanum]OAP38665.1 hypothetical protein ATC00_12240 [Sinorhizobium americanum]
MADDKTKTAADRRLVSGTQKYEVAYFAKKHGINAADARRIIKQHGGDRDAADKAANKLKG